MGKISVDIYKCRVVILTLENANTFLVCSSLHMYKIKIVLELIKNMVFTILI